MKNIKVPWHYWFLLLAIAFSYCILFSEGSVSSRVWVAAAVGLMGTFGGLILAVIQNHLREKAVDALEKAKQESLENARQAEEYKARLENEAARRVENLEKLNAIEQKVGKIAVEVEIQRRLQEDRNERAAWEAIQHLLEEYNP